MCGRTRRDGCEYVLRQDLRVGNNKLTSFQSVDVFVRSRELLLEGRALFTRPKMVCELFRFTLRTFT